MLDKNTRQRLFFAECHVIAHGSMFLFAVCYIARHTAKMRRCRVSKYLPCVKFLAHGSLFAVCQDVTFLAHGKEALCRVPEIVHTAKALAHGKSRVSGSGTND